MWYCYTGVSWSVDLCACLLVTFVSPAKTAEPIKMKRGNFELSSAHWKLEKHCQSLLPCTLQKLNTEPLLQLTAMLPTDRCSITLSPVKNPPPHRRCWWNNPCYHPSTRCRMTRTTLKKKVTSSNDKLIDMQCRAGKQRTIFQLSRRWMRRRSILLKYEWAG